MRAGLMLRASANRASICRVAKFRSRRLSNIEIIKVMAEAPGMGAQNAGVNYRPCVGEASKHRAIEIGEIMPKENVIALITKAEASISL